MGALEDRIAATEAKLKQLKAEQQKVETLKKAAEAKRKRQDNTRRNMVAGSVLLDQMVDGKWPEAPFMEMMDKALTRNEDRALFDLPALAESGKGQDGNE